MFSHYLQPSCWKFYPATNILSYQSARVNLQYPCSATIPIYRLNKWIGDWSTRNRSNLCVNREEMLILNHAGMDTLA